MAAAWLLAQEWERYETWNRSLSQAMIHVINAEVPTGVQGLYDPGWKWTGGGKGWRAVRGWDNLPQLWVNLYYRKDFLWPVGSDEKCIQITLFLGEISDITYIDNCTIPCHFRSSDLLFFWARDSNNSGQKWRGILQLASLIKLQVGFLLCDLCRFPRAVQSCRTWIWGTATTSLMTVAASLQNEYFPLA